MPVFHFHSFLLIFVNLWPISTLCVADMVHAVADVVCGRYCLWPIGFVADIVVSLLIGVSMNTRQWGRPFGYKPSFPLD